MAKLQYRSLSMRTVDGLSGDGKDIIFWDRELQGFGVRVYPSGAKVYLVQSRGPGGSKRVTLGRHGVISADRARRRAASIIARIKAGDEPKPPPSVPAAAGPTVAELAERYLSEHVAVHCKPNTAGAYRKVIGKHILPVYGKLAVTALGREHVAGLHYRLRKTPTAANNAIGALSRMLVCPTFSLLTNRLSTDVAAADYVDKCRLDGDRRHVKARSPEYGWERCGSVTRWKGSAGKAPAFPAGRSRTALSPRTRIRSGAWSAPPLFVSCVLNGCVGARPGLSCKDRSHGT